MEFVENVSDFLVLYVDFLDSVHGSALRTSLAFQGNLADVWPRHLPSITFTPSHTAPRTPATMTVMTALNV